jgi:hypothetical protein
MKPDRAWVLLPSGRRLDLLQPDADAWTDRDLAISLSRTYRWGGHSSWELPLSVTQHSLLVLVMRKKMNALQPLSRAEALRELLHDAEEGFLCFDPISPLKPHLGEDFKSVNDRLRAAIATRYAVQPWDCAGYLLHKQADHLAAASEAFHVTGWSRQDIRDSLHIRIDPVVEDPLPRLDGMQPWEPWPPRIAAALFLAKLRELTGPDGDVERPGDMSAVVEREQNIRTLATSFSRLSPGQGRRTVWPLTGNSLTDTYVVAEANDGFQTAEGVVMDGQRDEDGAWDFDADFTLFTTDEEILVCHGYNCHVEIQ